TFSPFMKVGLPRAISVSRVTVARITLTPLPGKVMLTVVVDDGVEPASEPFTVVGLPDSGVSLTWIVVPGAMFVAFTTTCTGFGTEVGTTISGGALIKPTGFAGAAIPPTEEILNEGLLARVTGFG